MRNVGSSGGWARRRRSGDLRLRNAIRQRRQWREFVQDVAATATPVAGRYQGSVVRESDGASFDRAIELGTVVGNRQSIMVYEEVGGGLPSTPQHAGVATLFGSNGFFFASTDNVADRKFLGFVFGDLMLSFSVSTYHDGRPDVKLGGALRRQ